MGNGVLIVLGSAFLVCVSLGVRILCLLRLRTFSFLVIFSCRISLGLDIVVA